MPPVEVYIFLATSVGQLGLLWKPTPRALGKIPCKMYRLNFEPWRVTLEM
jgi:hypothetical protein